MSNLTWENAPETLKVSEAATLTGFHINTIRSLIHRGLLAATRPSGTRWWRIQKSDLMDTMKSRPKTEEALQYKCSLCKESVYPIHGKQRIGEWAFHKSCYKVVVKRLEGFMEIALLPQKEWKEWGIDGNQ